MSIALRVRRSQYFTQLLHVTPCHYPYINYILSCVRHSTLRRPRIWMSFFYQRSTMSTRKTQPSNNVHIDNEYATWIAELKHRYRSAQTRAAVKVNAEKLLFNWQLGRDLVQKKSRRTLGCRRCRTSQF